MIFFRQPDGSWSDGIDIVRKLKLPCPEAISISFSPDMKYIFFASSHRSLTYQRALPGWEFKSLQELRNLPGNGNSDIYWIDLKSAMKKSNR